jgi:hypothetical protein
MTYSVNGTPISSDFTMDAPFSLGGNAAHGPLPVVGPLVIKGAIAWGHQSQVGGAGTDLGQTDWGKTLTVVTYTVNVTP